MQTLAERAEIALRMVREAPVLAFDVETSGLDWKTNWPVGYVTSVGRESVYVPIRHAPGGNLIGCLPLVSPTGPFDRHPYEQALEKAFLARRSLGHLTVGHNILFDCHFAANAGILLGRDLEDTQNNEAMIDEFTKHFSLDACARAHKVTEKLGDELYRLMADHFGGSPDRKQMEHFWRLPGNEPLAVDYSEGDGVSTYELWESQQRFITDDDLTYIHRIESRLIWTIFKIERKGIRVDLERLAVVRKQIARQVEEAKMLLPEGFNSRSGPQVRELMERAGHTDWPTTTLGNPSFTEKWLKAKPEGRAIVRLRKLSNLDNSFLAPLAERHVHNGRVYCQLNQLKGDEFGTITGRFSCSRPNLQQVPKRDKELGPLYRSIFVPDDGMEFVEADYSQVEPRLFAHYSGEPTLIDGYNATPPLDMHEVVAQGLAVERDPTAKRMNMGILTGMQAPTFAAHMEWPLDRAREQFDAWFRLFPGIKQFQDSATSRFASRGYVKTILKRRARLESRRFAYRAVSRIIQGSNADLIKYKLLQCDEYLESEGLDDIVQLLLTIHDSIALQNTMDEAGRAARKELIRICCDVQGPPFNLKVPFIMDVGIGPDWSVATYGDKNKEFD